MALIHLNQLRPGPTSQKSVPDTAPPPQPPVAAPHGKTPEPRPTAPASSPPAYWGAFSQRLLDKLVAVEQSATTPLQGGIPAPRPDSRN